jgi:D-allose transport system substrate-binding protein
MPATAAPATAAPATAAPATLKYGILLKTLSNPYWVTMKEGIEAEAAAKGVQVDIFAMNTEDDFAGQLAKLEDMLAKNEYSGIGVAPLDSQCVISALGKAAEIGMPILDIDEKFDLDLLKSVGGKVLALVTTDNVKVGEKGAKAVADKIGNEGKVAIIEGLSGSVGGDRRRQGAAEYFASIPDITVVASQPADWDRIKALDVATNILQANPDLKGFYCANDTMALGVLQAVENAGKLDSCIVCGTDGIDEAYQDIRDGKLFATVAQDPAGMGAKALDMLIDAVANGTQGTSDPPETYVDSILITKDNVPAA